MKEVFAENWPRLTCGQCKYFQAGADIGESTCKRLDHKHLKFAKPWFRCYDCGQFYGIVCREFEPADWCVWLKEHWRGYDDYYCGDMPHSEVAIVIDNVENVRYYIDAEDFINGTFFDYAGNLRYKYKQYYKKSTKSPVGYVLVKENNNEQTSNEN